MPEKSFLAAAVKGTKQRLLQRLLKTPTHHVTLSTLDSQFFVLCRSEEQVRFMLRNGADPRRLIGRKSANFGLSLNCSDSESESESVSESDNDSDSVSESESGSVSESDNDNSHYHNDNNHNNNQNNHNDNASSDSDSVENGEAINDVMDDCTACFDGNSAATFPHRLSQSEIDHFESNHEHILFSAPMWSLLCTELGMTGADFSQIREPGGVSLVDCIRAYRRSPTYKHFRRAFNPTRIETSYRKVAKTMQILGDRDTCAVCKDDFRGRDAVVLLHCKHLFHCACVSEIVKHRKRCPCCRQRT